MEVHKNQIEYLQNLMIRVMNYGTKDNIDGYTQDETIGFWIAVILHKISKIKKGGSDNGIRI